VIGLGSEKSASAGGKAGKLPERQELNGSTPR